MKRMNLVACNMAAAIAFVAAPAFASTLMLDFGTAVTTLPTDSPLHVNGGLALTETTWNHLDGDLGSGLLFSDGTAATGVSVDLGWAPGNSTVDLSNGVASGNGNSNGIFAAGTAGLDYVRPSQYGGASVHHTIGAQIDGLAAGTYEVYVVGRNFSTTQPMDLTTYAGGEAANGNFDYSGYDSMLLSATNYATSAWVEGGGNAGENYTKLTVEVDASGVLNVAVRTDSVSSNESRGFLNSIQITQVPEPSSIMLVGLGLAGCVVARRRSVCRKS